MGGPKNVAGRGKKKCIWRKDSIGIYIKNMHIYIEKK